MSAVDVWGYVTSKGGYRLHGSEAVGVCPVCRGGQTGERCVSVNVETGQWVCNRKNNCGVSGGFRDLRRAYGDDEPMRSKVTTIPTSYAEPKHNATALKADGRAFLNSRGLSDHTISVWRIGQDGEWICWPVTDATGKLVNIKSRHISEKKFLNKKGCAKWPVGVHRCIQINGKRLIITEGELDAMSGEQMGLRNIISLPNGSGDQDWIALAWDWLQQFDEIVLATDGDAAGDKARAEIVRRLGHKWLLRSVVLPDGHKDLNACLMADVEAERVVTAFAASEEIKPQQLHWVTEYMDELNDLFDSPDMISGTRSGIAQLDAMIKGFRTSEVTVWTGASGSGKSTVLGQLALNWLTMGKKVCVASMELKPARYLRWLTMQATGLEVPNRKQREEAVRWMGEGLCIFDHLGRVPIDEILSGFAYAAQRYGVTQFVCDSLMMVSAHRDELTEQKIVVEKLTDFANTYSVHVHLVAHPRKGQTDGQELGKVDIKGAAEIANMAHCVIAVQRSDDFTALVVKKNREHGSEGKAIVTVDAKSKRVYDSAGPLDFWPYINAADDNIPEWTDDPQHFDILDTPVPLTTIYGAGA